MKINFNPNSKNNINACPCYIHTHETGTFVWSSYIDKEMEPLKASGFLGDCHYIEQTNATGVGWHVKKENNKYLLESSNYKINISGSEGAQATTKNEIVWIAPAIFINGTAGTDTYTISVTLETIGDGSGHKAELLVGTRAINKKHPEESLAVVLESESAFSTKVIAAMTAAGYTAYGSLGGDEFSTNRNKITITSTYTTVTNDNVIYLGIKDTSPVPDNTSAKFRIHEITVEARDYYDIIPTSFPDFKPQITPIKNNTKGKIEFNNPAEAVKCIWCWGDGTVVEKTLPSRTDLGRGWHYLKGVNITEGYTLPVQRFHMRQTKSASPTVSWPPYSMQSLINKYNLLYNNWVGGMKGCASETMKAHVLDYLYKKMYPEEEPVFGAYIPSIPGVTGGGFLAYLFANIQSVAGNEGFASVPVSSSGLLEELDTPGGSKHQYLGRGPNASFSNGIIPGDGGSIINGIGVYAVSLADCADCTASTLPHKTISNSLITQLGSASTTINPIAGILPTSQTSTDIVTGGGNYITQNVNIFIQDGQIVEEEPWWNPADINQDGTINLPDLFAVLDGWLQSADWAGSPQGMPSAQSLPWNGGQNGSVESAGRCCTGDQDYAYPAITFHKDKFWELKNERSSGKTEPGTFLGRNDWQLLNLKTFKGKKENVIKRLENKRKKSIFELEDKYAVVYSGSLDATTRGRAVTSSTIELENLDILRPEFNKSRTIT